MNIKTTVRLFFVALVSAVSIIACRERAISSPDRISADMEVYNPKFKVWSMTLDSGQVMLPNKASYDLKGIGLRSVPAKFFWMCEGPGGPTHGSAWPDANGYLQIQCPAGKNTIEISATFDSSPYLTIDSGTWTSSVPIPNRELYYFIEDGDQTDTLMWPILPAFVYSVVHQDVPRANTKFSPYALTYRPAYHASYGDTTGSGNMGGGASIGGSTAHVNMFLYGRYPTYQNWPAWNIMHEQGHVFQLSAIIYGGLQPNWLTPMQTTQFVEGFADWFATLIAGYRYSCVTGEFSNCNSTVDNVGMERDSQAVWSANASENGSNAMCCGGEFGPGRQTIASFFYDIVDASSDSDGVSNAPDGDDDSITYPASYIASLFYGNTSSTAKCKINSIAYGGWRYGSVNLEHLLACMEHTVALRVDVPAAYQASWDSVSSYTETVTEPSGWNASKIRQLWKFDLFNVGSLP